MDFIYNIQQSHVTVTACLQWGCPGWWSNQVLCFLIFGSWVQVVYSTIFNCRVSIPRQSYKPAISRDYALSRLISTFNYLDSRYTDNVAGIYFSYCKYRRYKTLNDQHVCTAYWYISLAQPKTYFSVTVLSVNPNRPHQTAQPPRLPIGTTDRQRLVSDVFDSVNNFLSIWKIFQSHWTIQR